MHGVARVGHNVAHGTCGSQLLTARYLRVCGPLHTGSELLEVKVVATNPFKGEIQNCRSFIFIVMLLFVVQLLSHVQHFATPQMAVHQASLSFTISQSLLKLTSIKSLIPSNHLVLCCPLLLLLSIFPSIRVFSCESTLCIMWPKYWSFSFSISPSNGYSGLTSFRIDWLDLAVQGTLKSLPQHHS